MQKEIYSSAISITMFFINTILIFRVVEMELAIEYVIGIISAVSFGILYYKIFSDNLGKVGVFFMASCTGMGMFLYTMPVSILYSIFLCIELAGCVILVFIHDNIPENIIQNIPEYKAEIKESDQKDLILKLHREKKKQTEIAEITGKSQGYISKLINEHKLN